MLSQRTVSKLEILLIKMYSRPFYDVAPILAPGVVFSYLYQEGVDSPLLNWLGHEFDFQPNILVRSLHEGVPIRRFARYHLDPKDAVDYADIILLLVGTLALEKFSQLEPNCRTMFENEVNEFLISARSDRFPFVAGAFRDINGKAINADRLWDLSSPRPSSSNEMAPSPPSPAPATTKPPQPTSSLFTARSPSHSVPVPPKTQDTRRSPMSSGLFWTIVGVLIAVATLIATIATPELRRLVRLDKTHEPSSAAPAQQNRNVSPASSEPARKPQDTTQLQSAPQRLSAGRNIKINQHGEGNGAVGGNITTGPCSNVQIGGNGNEASVACGTVRSLSTQEKTQLVENLRQVPPGIATVWAVETGQSLGEDIYQTLKTSGWKMQEPGIQLMFLGQPMHEDIDVFVHGESGDTGPFSVSDPTVVKLMQSLKALGRFKTALGRSEKVDKGVIKVSVGPPLPTDQ